MSEPRRRRVKLQLLPYDVDPAMCGEDPTFFGIHRFFVETPHGPAPVAYLLYRPTAGRILVHAELTEWSFEECSTEQVDWMVDHPAAVREALRLALEDVFPKMR